jgi:Mg-chelatase subunit ChlD
MPAHLIAIGYALDRPGWCWLLMVLAVIPLLSRRSLAGVGHVRMILAIVLRCSVIALLVLAIANMQETRKIDDQAVVFVVDGSRSMPVEQRRSAAEFMRSATSTLRPGKDRVGVLQFADGAQIEQTPAPALAASSLSVLGRDDRTDIAGGLRLASAVFSADTAQRIVLISDGNENVSDALSEARSLAAKGIPVDVLKCDYEHRREVVFESMNAPAHANQAEPIKLSLLLRSQEQCTGRIVVYQNGAMVGGEKPGEAAGWPIEVRPGPNRFELPIPMTEGGPQRFKAEFIPDDPSQDMIAANNSAMACTVVQGGDHVLVLTDAMMAGPDQAQSAQLFVEAIGRERIESEVVDVSNTTLDIPALVDHSTVVLSNVSISSLGTSGQEALATYVRDLGGGLVVIGGDQSFSAGGYDNSLLEAILPVKTNQQAKAMLNAALVIVLDRSGSMTGEKLNTAKKAAIGAAELLSRLDYIGVIAFDSIAEWAVPLTLCANRAAVRAGIAAISEGGGTDMYPAMVQGGNRLRSASAASKHMIILTDGQSAPGDFEGVTGKMRFDGITVSSIAVGGDADQGLLKRIAKQGGGRFYSVDGLKTLPRIFARETMLVGRRGIVQEAFKPELRPTDDEAITAGLKSEDIPQLKAYVIASPKPGASTAMVRTRQKGEDPLLASWRVGLGRSVAFTSGMWPRWGPEWTTWPSFSKLWAQVIRWASRSANSSKLELETGIDGQNVRVGVEIDDKIDASTKSQSVVGRIIDPQGKVHRVDLKRVGSGRFEGVFAATSPGSYVVQAGLSRGDAAAGGMDVTHAVVSVAYSPEYKELKSNEQLLSEIASQTGGQVLDAQEPATVFDPKRIQSITAQKPLWEFLLKLAIALFILDVAVRRLDLDLPGMSERFSIFLSQVSGRARPQVAVEALSSLKNVRARAQASMSAPPKRSAADSKLPGVQWDAAPPAIELPKASTPTKSPEPRKPAPTETSPDEGGITGRLLANKRRRLDEERRDS